MELKYFVKKCFGLLCQFKDYQLLLENNYFTEIFKNNFYMCLIYY